MGQIQLTVTLDERAYHELERRAQSEQREVGALLQEIIARDLEQPPAESAPRAAVVASLERSLTEHADVWTELDKH